VHALSTAARLLDALLRRLSQRRLLKQHTGKGSGTQTWGFEGVEELEAGPCSSFWLQHLSQSGTRDQQRAAAKAKVPEMNS